MLVLTVAVVVVVVDDRRLVAPMVELSLEGERGSPPFQPLDDSPFVT